MDKDMERLGKERLKRVRRRRQLATFIISMAVIVLGITAYRLIQPASAEDQNKYEFEVDGQFPSVHPPRTRTCSDLLQMQVV